MAGIVRKMFNLLKRVISGTAVSPF